MKHAKVTRPGYGDEYVDAVRYALRPKRRSAPYWFFLGFGVAVLMVLLAVKCG